VPRTATSSLASVIAGRAVREARRTTGITQAELAHRIGSSAPHVCALENGKANPTIGHLSEVAAALGMELHIELRQLPAFLESESATSSDIRKLAERSALAS